MDTIKGAVTDLLSQMQYSPERTLSTTPEASVSDDRGAHRIGIRDAWAVSIREKAIAALGAKPFSYDEQKIQKRDLLGQMKSSVIAGLPGRGKSMAMAWVIDQVAKNEAQKHYEAHDMSVLQDIGFLFTSSSALWDAFHTGTCPDPHTQWAFIDDWGMEYREPFAVSRADEWFRIREATSGVHTWLTTNLSREQFLTQPGLERIVSRIQGSMDWIEFTGVDRRKSWKK